MSTFSGLSAKRVQAVRTIRWKRKPEYLNVRKPPAPSSNPNDGVLKRQFREFLGPQNSRGEYYRNRYYYPPQNNSPNYVDPRSPSVVETEVIKSRQSQSSPLQPFPQNQFTQTAKAISPEIKEKIVKEVEEDGKHTQEVAHKYGIKLPRVEAILKLQQVEREWKAENKISKELAKFSSVFSKMFPLFDAPRDSDNLTEIPAPAKTLNQRFLTISESEPFGPVDAARIYGLETAQETLDNLTEFKEPSEQAQKKLNEVIVGEERQGENTQFKFTKATVGEVGFRYGASRRDRKKDRAIGFDRHGHMVYYN